MDRTERFYRIDRLLRERRSVPLKRFLEDLSNRSKYFGSLIGVESGEPFFVREALNIEDPVELLTRPMNLYS